MMRRPFLLVAACQAALMLPGSAHCNEWPGTLQGIVEIVSGDSYVCALLRSGRLLCVGALAVDTTDCPAHDTGHFKKPTRVARLRNIRWIESAEDFGYLCLRMEDGSRRC